MGITATPACVLRLLHSRWPGKALPAVYGNSVILETSLKPTVDYYYSSNIYYLRLHVCCPSWLRGCGTKDHKFILASPTPWGPWVAYGPEGLPNRMGCGTSVPAKVPWRSSMGGGCMDVHH